MDLYAAAAIGGLLAILGISCTIRAAITAIARLDDDLP